MTEHTLEDEVIILDEKLTKMYDRIIRKMLNKIIDSISESDDFYKDLGKLFGENSDLYKNCDLSPHETGDDMLYIMECNFEEILKKRIKNHKRIKIFLRCLKMLREYEVAVSRQT